MRKQQAKMRYYHLFLKSRRRPGGGGEIFALCAALEFTATSFTRSARRVYKGLLLFSTEAGILTQIATGDEDMFKRANIVKIKPGITLIDDAGNGTCYVVEGRDRALQIDTRQRA